MPLNPNEARYGDSHFRDSQPLGTGLRVVHSTPESGAPVRNIKGSRRFEGMSPPRNMHHRPVSRSQKAKDNNVGIEIEGSAEFMDQYQQETGEQLDGVDRHYVEFMLDDSESNVFG